MSSNNPSSMSKKELAAAYKISSVTLYRRLKAIKLTTTDRILLPEQLTIIFLHYGKPTS